MRFYVLALLGASVSCHAMTSSQPPGPRAAAFSRYRTFSFALSGQPPEDYDVSERSIEAEARARQVIVATLVRKGYAAESAKGDPGDFIVRLSSGTRQIIPVDGDDGYRPEPPSRPASRSTSSTRPPALWCLTSCPRGRTPTLPHVQK